MTEQSLEMRLKRIESRLCQLMLHLGLDPYQQAYKHDLEDSVG